MSEHDTIPPLTIEDAPRAYVAHALALYREAASILQRTNHEAVDALIMSGAGLSGDQEQRHAAQQLVMTAALFLGAAREASRRGLL